jgi:ribonucleoside-diphosphate reductase beta chain
MIARDEALHLAGTQHMLNLMSSGKDDPDMQKIAPLREVDKLACI